MEMGMLRLGTRFGITLFLIALGATFFEIARIKFLSKEIKSISLSGVLHVILSCVCFSGIIFVLYPGASNTILWSVDLALVCITCLLMYLAVRGH